MDILEHVIEKLFVLKWGFLLVIKQDGVVSRWIVYNDYHML